MPASPSIALNLADPFDHCIFCEHDSQAADALGARVARDHAHLDVTVLRGDANDLVDDVIGAMPDFGRNSTVLAFCFVDPFRVSRLPFATIQALAARYMDFLILIPTGVDASRNWRRQMASDDLTSLDEFLGTGRWRGLWEKELPRGTSFDGFFTSLFSERMRSIDYVHGGVDSSVLIRNPDKNQRLYRLGFYSKHPLASRSGGKP